MVQKLKNYRQPVHFELPVAFSSHVQIGERALVVVRVWAAQEHLASFRVRRIT